MHSGFARLPRLFTVAVLSLLIAAPAVLAQQQLPSPAAAVQAAHTLAEAQELLERAFNTAKATEAQQAQAAAKLERSKQFLADAKRRQAAAQSALAGVGPDPQRLNIDIERAEISLRTAEAVANRANRQHQHAAQTLQAMSRQRDEAGRAYQRLLSRMASAQAERLGTTPQAEFEKLVQRFPVQKSSAGSPRLRQAPMPQSAGAPADPTAPPLIERREVLTPDAERSPVSEVQSTADTAIDTATPATATPAPEPVAVPLSPAAAPLIEPTPAPVAAPTPDPTPVQAPVVVETAEAPIPQPPADPIDPRPTLTVRTAPEGAEVRVLTADAAYRPGMRLSTGTHEVEVSLSGYQSTTFRLNLTEGEERDVRIRLDPVPRPIAEIEEQPVAPAASPAPAAPPLVAEVSPEPAQPEPVAPLIEPTPEPEPEPVDTRPTLTVETDPASARVQVLTVVERYEPRMRLPAGAHRVRVSAEGYEGRIFVLSLEPEDTRTVRVALDPVAAPVPAPTPIVEVAPEPEPVVVAEPALVAAAPSLPQPEPASAPEPEPTPAPVAFGSLTVDTWPRNATVTLNGSPVPSRLRSGPVTLSVSAPGFESATVETIIHAGENPLAVGLQRIGRAAETTAANGVTLTVAASGGGHYSDLASAIAAADPGDRILVRGGIYEGALAVSIPLTIEAARDGTGPVTIRGGNGACLTATAPVTLSGLIFENNAATACIDITAGNGLLEQLEISNSVGTGLLIRGDATPLVRAVTLSNNDTALTISGAARPHIENIVMENNDTGLWVIDQAEPTLRQLTFSGHRRQAVLIQGGRPMLTEARLTNNAGPALDLRGGTLFATDTVISDNSDDGVIATETAGGTLTNSEITGNTANGITVASEGRLSLVANQISGNGQAGLLVNGRTKVRVTDSDVSNNEVAAMIVTGRAAPVVLRNRFDGGQANGVRIEERASGLFEDNLIRNHAENGIVLGGVGASLIGNEITDNGEAGMFITGAASGALLENVALRNETGVFVQFGSRVTMTDGRIAENRGTGLALDEGAVGGFAGISITGNGVHGVLVPERAAPELNDNLIEDNGADGVNIAGSGRYTANRIRNNGGFGMRASGVGAVIDGNRVEGNIGVGIWLGGAADGTVSTNAVNGNGAAGIEATDAAQPILVQNRVERNGSAGIFVHGDDARGRIEGNQVSVNATAGIEIADEAQPLVSRNQVSGNGTEGILIRSDAVPTVENNQVAPHPGGDIVRGE